MITTTLKNAWRIYRERFGLIAAVVIAVWLPCELLNSYCDAFVFGRDNFRSSFKLARFLDNFFGIIATAGVVSITSAACSGQPATFGEAIGAGFSAWGRMFWTRLLAGLAIIFGLLLLIVPGVFLLVRFCFAESVAVVEHTSGTDALARSFEITKGRFWQTLGFCLVVALLIVVPVIVVILPGMFIPALDHWLIDAATSLAADVLASFATVTFLCGYEVYTSPAASA